VTTVDATTRPQTAGFGVAESEPTTPVARNTHSRVDRQRNDVWGGFRGSESRWTPAAATTADRYLDGARAERRSRGTLRTDRGVDRPEMIVWGGYNSGYLATGGRYDPKMDTWTATALGASQRTRHAAVWTGSEMIIWEEILPDVTTSTGGRYNPATNTWIAVRSDATTPPRALSHGVWTGSRMIVWGGFSGVNGSGAG